MVELLLVFVSNFTSEMNFMSLKVVFFLVQGVLTGNVMLKNKQTKKRPSDSLGLVSEFACGYLLYFDQGSPVLMLLVPLRGGATWNLHNPQGVFTGP